MNFERIKTIIEAEQFFHDKHPWPDGVEFRTCFQNIGGYVTGMAHPQVKTPNGWIKINDGDWIVKDESGMYYPISDEVFMKTYKPIEE